MQEGFIDSNLPVADGAELHKVLITNFLLDWNKLCLVSVVALLYRFVETFQYGVLPADVSKVTGYFRYAVFIVLTLVPLGILPFLHSS